MNSVGFLYNTISKGLHLSDEGEIFSSELLPFNSDVKE